jgi:hypothetical protein
MNYNKLILTILTLMLCISGVSASSINDSNRYWSMNNTLIDMVNGYALTNVGAIYTSAGKLDGAYNFDGSNDYMTNNFITPDLISINMWVKRDDIGATSDLLSKHSNNAGNYGFVFGFTSTNRLIFYRSTTGNDWDGGLSTSNISDTVNYNMVSLTYNGTNAKFYINGVLDNTIALSGDLFNSAWDMSIGARKTGFGTSTYYNGSIDEIGIWDRELSSDEIAQLYNNNNALTYPFIIPFDITANNYYNTTTPTIYFNSSQNASMFGYAYWGNVTSYDYDKNDGTIYGKTFNDGVAYNGVEFDGESAVFDGSDDYVSVSSNNLPFDNNNNITFTGWFYPNVNTDSLGIFGQQTEIILRHQSSNRLELILNSFSTNDRVDSISTFVINDWNFYAGYYDGTNLCININNGVNNCVIPTGSWGGNVNDFVIGKAGSIGNVYDGSIRDVRIYNKSLSQAEITQLYNEENETTDGLVAYYPLHDNANDMNHIASHRDSSQAMNFDGVDDYVETDYFSDISRLKNYTFSLWFNPTLEGGSEQILVMNSISSSDRNGVTLRNDGRIAVSYYDGSIKTSSSISGLTANNWYNLVGTNTDGNLKLYLNGIYKIDESVYDGYVLADKFRISGYTARPFNGNLDDIRIYNRSLSQEDITKLYQGTYTNTTGLVAHYDFEELEHDSIHDRNFAICTNCQSGNYTYNVGTEGLYTNWFYDELNNNTEYNTFIVDVTNPTTSIGITGTIGDNNYYTINPQVTLTATDLIDEVAYTSYRINSGSWINYTTTIDISTQGNVLLEFYSVDNAGNQETIKNISFKVDTATPTTTHTITGTIENTWYKTQPSIELIPTDVTSGIYETYYRLDGGDWTLYSSNFIITKEGTTFVEYYSIDNAGNTETIKDFNIKVDTISPITTPTITGTIGENDWYITNANVSLSGVDDTSGIDYVNYSLNGGNDITYSTNFIVSNNGNNEVLYYGVDNAGNQESVKSLEFKIDTVAPNSSIEFQGIEGSNNWYISFVNTTISSNDDTSGIDYTEYRINSGSWITYTSKFIINTQGNSTIEYRSIDNAGNVEDTQEETIKIDTIEPVIIETFPDEVNSYTIVDFDIYINIAETNDYTCVVNALYNDVLEDTFNCNQSSITLLKNGNYTFNIDVNDSANNTAQSNLTIFINPINYFYFELDNGTQVTNFTFGGSNFDEKANFTHYELGLGEISLQFSKLGYLQENFSFNLTDSNQLNQTFIVTTSKISIFVYDRLTGDLVTGNTSISLVATIGFEGWTTTGTKNITNLNFVSGQYQVIINNDEYETETIYFDYTNLDVLEVDAYLIKSNQSNLGTVTVKAIANTGQLIEGAICNALEWKPSLSAYVSVAQGQTNSIGETVLNIELSTKLYKFSCSKSGITSTTSSQILTSTEQIVPIVLQSTIDIQVDKYKDITYSLINQTYNSTHNYIIYTFNDDSGLDNEYCLKIYKKEGIKLTELQSSCITSNSGQIQLIQDINESYIVQAVGYVTIDDVQLQLIELTFDSYQGLSETLEDYGFDAILPLLFVLLGIALGFMITPNNVYISIFGTIVMVWISFMIVPSVISGSIATFITTVCCIMLYGGSKNK